MEENLKALWDQLQGKVEIPGATDYGSFQNLMSDSANSRAFYDQLKGRVDFGVEDYEGFSSTYLPKKKVGGERSFRSSSIRPGARIAGSQSDEPVSSKTRYKEAIVSPPEEKEATAIDYVKAVPELINKGFYQDFLGGTLKGAGEIHAQLTRPIAKMMDIEFTSEDSWLWQAGNAVSKQFDEGGVFEGAAPQEVLESDFGQIGRGVGQMTGMVMSAPKSMVQGTFQAGNVLKEGAKQFFSRPAVAGSLQMVSAEGEKIRQEKEVVENISREEYVSIMGEGSGEKYDKLKSSDAEDILTEMLPMTLAAGSTEAIPVAGFFKRMNTLTGGGFTKAVLRKTKDITVGTVEGAAQEALQEYMVNLGAQDVYDYTKDVTEGLEQSAKVGGGVQLIFEIIGSAIGARKKGANASDVKVLEEAEALLAEKESVLAENLSEEVSEMAKAEGEIVSEENDAVRELVKVSETGEGDMGILIDAAKDPEGTMDAVKSKAEELGITEEDVEAVETKVAETVAAQGKVPEGLKDNPEVVGSVIEKAELDAEAELLEQEKAGLDEAFHEPINERLKEIEEEKNKLNEKIKSIQPSEEPVPDKKKKTILTKRSYEGDLSEEVKSYLEEKGLEREVVSQAERSAQAEQFINEFGEENSERAVRDYTVRGALASSILTKLIKRVDDQMWETEQGSEEMSKLAQKQADLIELLETEAMKSGEFAGQLAREYVEEDIGYAHEIQKRKYEKKFGAIPEDVDAKFKEIDTKLRRLRKEIADAEKGQEEQAAQQSVSDIKESIEREKSGGKKTDIRERAKRLADNIRKGKVTRPDVFSAASPASLVWDVALEIVATSIEAGATVADAVKNGVEHIRESDWYQNLTRGKQLEAENAFNSSFQEETVSDLKIPKQLIRDLVDGGIDDINALVDAVRAEMGLEGYSDREIRDAITEYGKTVNMNRTELTDKISKLKNLGRLLSQLEDVKSGKKPKRSGLQRRRPEAEERALQRQVRELMKELPQDAETLATEQKTALDAKKTRLKNQIEDLEREIASRKTTERSSKQVEPDQELKDLIEKKDAKKKEWDEIFRDEEFIEKRRLEQAKKRTQKAIEDLERRLKEKDFSKREVKPVTEDSELTKLKTEKLRLKEEYDKEMYKKQLQERTWLEKRKDQLWDAWSLTRALMATGEFSFIGIQGLVQTIAHPKNAKKAFKNSLKFLTSEKRTDEWIRHIKSQDYYADMSNSKLAITEPHAQLKAREELFYSEWSNLVWDTIGVPFLWFGGRQAWSKWRNANPLRAVERAAVGYLDTLRVERFLQVRQKMLNEGKTFQDSPQDYKDVADAINTLTGRASLGKAELFAPTLTKLFFSPRNWASQLKTATPYALYYFGRLTPTARKEALYDFGKAVGFTTSMVMLAAAYLNGDDDDETGVEFDPRSSDFMKIKLGNKRVDPWGGRIQQIVLTARFLLDVLHDIDPEMSKGGFKNLKGEVYPLGTRFKSQTKQEVLLQAAINKLAPSAAIMNRYFSKQEDKGGNFVTKFGEPYSLTDDIVESLWPIYWTTIGELIKEDGGYDAMDGLLTFAAFFGVGVNVYGMKDRKKYKDGYEALLDKGIKIPKIGDTDLFGAEMSREEFNYYSLVMDRHRRIKVKEVENELMGMSKEDIERNIDRIDANGRKVAKAITYENRAFLDMDNERIDKELENYDYFVDRYYDLSEEQKEKENELEEGKTEFLIEKI